MRGDRYQILLILSGVVTTLLFGWFLYKEIFPEYKIYQDAYVELEEFRSTYTGQPAPDFRRGIKQIVIEQKDLGPPIIDRCTSCHVALQFQHFSPTQIARDANGEIILDEQGLPKKEPNPSYVWAKLDEKIADLTDPVQNEKLASEGKQSLVNQRIAEAERLKTLKTVQDGEHVWNMAKVLQMHPLIGSETRPFEFHSIDDYGCVSCHGGNGRGLTTLKAHGPVFEGQFEEEDIGPVPQFLESDEENDPKFSKVFNGKPGHELLFQTTPILVGDLMEAKCVQCHQSSKSIQQTSIKGAGDYTNAQNKRKDSITQAYDRELNELVSLVQLKLMAQNLGVAQAVEQLRAESEDYKLPESTRKRLDSQADLLVLYVGGNDGLRKENAQPALDVVVQKLDKRISALLGSDELTQELSKSIDAEGVDAVQIVNQFIFDHPHAGGSIFIKAQAVNHLDASQLPTEVDLLTQNFHQGEFLYVNQACYACHRITGFARGGVGPELTEIGNYYPWYIKESIVWPQADLKTSTMPNYKLDHQELEDLVTFLLAQKGASRIISASDYRQAVRDWDSGKKLPWEMPATPAQMHDVNYGLTVFATEGCAACHRLRGFTSNVGFAIDQKDPSFEERYEVQQWFRRTIPENVSGSDLVHILETKADEIDRYIVDNVRSDSIIEEIEAKHPGNVESFYSHFQYAKRARNHEFKDDPKQLKEWQDRVWRALMMYVQEYGYGRVVGPRPNWSGIYRSDEWLIEHFYKPSGLVARSIMPVFPFNDTKFYALTYMLNVIAKHNRDIDRKVWNERGFNPETAYNLYCAQCHGDQRVGNGPVSEWIYPVPKNLRNADFMRNLTPARAKQSIMHGVAGGPMPPWGESQAKAVTGDTPVLTAKEVDQLVNWLYSSLPGSTVIPYGQDVPKWEYEPEDVIQDLKREGSELESKQPLSFKPIVSTYLAAIGPVVTPSEVSQVFDVVTAPNDIDSKHYFIKKQFYTPGNLEAGKHYFELNCAACHGREGDGAGARAGVMQDAKPRMLINFPWLETRDDLRLIRSIKFGVPGTSMQPWGDQTNALQRMQLVMYIRSLSVEQDYREQLVTQLYKNFDQSRVAIESSRIKQSPLLIQAENELAEVTKKQHDATQRVEKGTGTPEEASALYKQELELSRKASVLRANDAKYQQLIDLVYHEKKIYDEIGLSIIGLSNRDAFFEPYLQFLNLQEQKIRYQDGNLVLEPSKLEERTSVINALLENLQREIGAQEVELTQMQGKIQSPEQKELILEANGKLQSLKKVRNSIISGVEESKRITDKQQQILKELKNETDNDSSNNSRTADGHARSSAL